MLTPHRKYLMQIGGEPSTAEETAYRAQLMRDNPPHHAPRQADAFQMEADDQISYDRDDDSNPPPRPFR
jgi:hypothetical protein